MIIARKEIALVTGASRGLGREIAIGLAAAGFTVIAVARSNNDLRELEEIHPGKIFGYQVDVSELDMVEQLSTEISREHGVIQILVNAAGVFGPINLIQNTDPNEWATTLMIDTVAPYFLIRTFLPNMLESGWGRIINISSAASLHPPGRLNSAYGTAKVALNQLTRHLATEIAGSGVTANVIHPGDVKTAMWADIKEKATALGKVGDDFVQWVQWVDKTGGDDPKKAAELILQIISADYENVNGKFLWINDPLQSPITSWDDPSDSKPWQ